MFQELFLHSVQTDHLFSACYLVAKAKPVQKKNVELCKNCCQAVHLARQSSAGANPLKSTDGRRSSFNFFKIKIR
jgi:hypothetical protein